MTTAHQILIDLSISQATTNALAERIHQPPKVLAAFCQDLEIDGLVQRIPIKDELFAWKLTTSGHDTTRKLLGKTA